MSLFWITALDRGQYSQTVTTTLLNAEATLHHITAATGRTQWNDWTDRYTKFLEPIQEDIELGEFGCDSIDGALRFSRKRPMWKPEHRQAAEWYGLRYPSDLTDAEWRRWRRWFHRPGTAAGRGTSMSRGLDAICYVLLTGCQCRRCRRTAAAEHSAPLLHAVGLDGTLARIHHALYVATREQAGREASPTAAIIDSQGPRRLKGGSCARPAGLRCKK